MEENLPEYPATLAEQMKCLNDPEWQQRREVEWQSVADRLGEDYSRKQLNVIKAYFFTGQYAEIPRANWWISWLLDYFPVRSIESWHYINANILTEANRAKAFRNLLSDLYRNTEGWMEFAANGRKIVHIGMTKESCLHLFDQLFGAQFRPTVKLETPEVGLLENTFFSDVNNPFATSARQLRCWLEGDRHQTDCLLRHRLDYLFSALEYLCPEYSAAKICSDKAYGVEQEDLWQLLYLVANAPEKAPEPEDEKAAFLAEFRRRMDALENPPGELKQLWQGLKNGSIVFPQKLIVKFTLPEQQKAQFWNLFWEGEKDVEVSQGDDSCDWAYDARLVNILRQVFARFQLYSSELEKAFDYLELKEVESEFYKEQGVYVYTVESTVFAECIELKWRELIRQIDGAVVKLERTASW